MNPTRRLALWMILAVGVWSQPGCIRFFPVQYVPGADKDASRFVFVEEVRGDMLVLHDGGLVRLDGLDVGGISPHQQDMLADAVKTLASVPESRDGPVYRGLLVGRSGDSREISVSWPYMNRNYHYCGFRPIDVFPVRKEIPPQRFDLLECLLKNGLARADLQAVADTARRKRYQDAEGIAKTFGIGVWAAPGEQFLDAVATGDADEIRRLLEAGVPVNYVGQKWPPKDSMWREWGELPKFKTVSNAYRNTGMSPLMVAIEWNRVEIAELLLQRGADLNRKDASGRTPLDYARNRGNNDSMVKLLTSRGAQ